MPRRGTVEDARPLETLVNDRTPLLSLSTPRRRSCRDVLDVAAIPALIAVAITASGEQVLRAMIASNLYHYRWFFVQLMCLWSVCLTSFALVLRCILFGKSMNFRAVPLKALFVLAFLDTSHSLLLILPSGAVPFSVALLLPQFTIIFTIGLQRITSRQCPSLGYCIGYNHTKKRKKEGTTKNILNKDKKRNNNHFCFLCVSAGLVFLAPVIAVAPCWSSYQACPPTQDICGRSKTEILANAGILVSLPSFSFSPSVLLLSFLAL